MRQYLIMCRSITNAQRAARTLEKGGYSAVVTKAPQKASSNGCIYCLKISERKLKSSMDILKNSGLITGRVFVVEEDGSVGELRYDLS